MEKQPFEDAAPIKNGDFPASHVSFLVRKPTQVESRSTLFFPKTRQLMGNFPFPGRNSPRKTRWKATCKCHNFLTLQQVSTVGLIHPKNLNLCLKTDSFHLAFWRSFQRC